MRIAVIGTGALGCWFAAQLAPHAEVWMLGEWAAAIEAVQRNGVCVHEGKTARRVHVHAITDPAGAPPADIALVLVKSYQTARAAAWAAACLAPNGLALTLQNGLDNGPRLAAAVGAGRCGVGATFEAATVLAPGEVRHAGRGATYLGMWDGERNRQEHTENAGLAAATALLAAAGFEAQARDDMAAVLWGKAVVNAAINPLTALWRVSNGALLANAARRALLAALAREAAAAAAAVLAGRGLALPYADAQALVEAVCRATAANHSSMLQDVQHGRPTEIDSINGVIVAEGRRLGIPTPLNEAVWRLVQGLSITI